MATAVPARLGLNRFSGYEAANGLLMNSSLGFMHVQVVSRGVVHREFSVRSCPCTNDVAKAKLSNRARH
jgi:hypothetical protein